MGLVSGPDNDLGYSYTILISIPDKDYNGFLIRIRFSNLKFTNNFVFCREVRYNNDKIYVLNVYLTM